jgi:hypothetical protein
MKQRLERPDAIFDDDRLRPAHIRAIGQRILLWLLIALTPLFAQVLSAHATDDSAARSLYQSSPLSPLAGAAESPLVAPLAAAESPSTAIQSSNVSVYLVGMVMMSMLVVAAMVVWRRQ